MAIIQTSFQWVNGCADISYQWCHRLDLTGKSDIKIKARVFLVITMLVNEFRLAPVGDVAVGYALLANRLGKRQAAKNHFSHCAQVACSVCLVVFWIVFFERLELHSLQNCLPFHMPCFAIRGGV